MYFIRMIILGCLPLQWVTKQIPSAWMLVLKRGQVIYTNTSSKSDRYMNICWSYLLNFRNTVMVLEDFLYSGHVRYIRKENKGKQNNEMMLAIQRFFHHIYSRSFYSRIMLYCDLGCRSLFIFKIKYMFYNTLQTLIDQNFSLCWTIFYIYWSAVI